MQLALIFFNTLWIKSWSSSSKNIFFFIVYDGVMIFYLFVVSITMLYIILLPNAEINIQVKLVANSFKQWSSGVVGLWIVITVAPTVLQTFMWILKSLCHKGTCAEFQYTNKAAQCSWVYSHPVYFIFVEKTGVKWVIRV